MTTPLVLSDDTVLLLGRFADALDTQRPDAEMRDEIRLARALVLAEQLHGPTEKAFAAEQDLLAAAPASATARPAPSTPPCCALSPAG